MTAERCPRLERISIAGFRNHARLDLTLDGRNVAVIGANGIGKTNLLEAISLLAPGRGLRRALLAEFLGPAAASWAIGATVTTPNGRREVATALEQTGRGDRRVATIDGGTRKGPVALAGVLPLVWLTPAMDRVFVDSASSRRRLIDRLVFAFDPDHAERLVRYDRACRERLEILRTGPRDPAWLTTIEARMAADAVAIAAARLATCQRINQAADPDALFPAASLTLAGAVETALLTTPALGVEEDLARQFARARSRDGEAGTTTLGPQRSDLGVTERATGRPAKAGSTGEQKALLIALILAHAAAAAAAGVAPVLLFDEVAAHLDQTRRRALYSAIQRHPGQVWLTGTEADVFAGLGATTAGFELTAHGPRPVEFLP